MTTRTIAAILYPDVLATSLTLPMEIFHAAGQMLQRESDNPSIHFILASEDGQAITAASGLPMHAHCCWSDIAQADLVILPAIWRNPLRGLRHTNNLTPLLHHWQAQDTILCSVGSASFVLAQAGLLKGKAATTHWQYFSLFARRYPDVLLKRRHLITQADNLYCTGSVNSIADFAVHIVQQWYGQAIARALENQFSPEIRHPFNATAYRSTIHSSHHDELVYLVQNRLQEQIISPPTIAAMAKDLNISHRTLNRRFRDATGLSPQSYLQTLRISTAKDLLRHSNLSISEIAWQVGLQDTSYFARLFHRHCGISPLAYRKAVRGKRFVPDASQALAYPSLSDDGICG